MGKTKFRWLKRSSKADAEAPYETPVWLGNMSNGEFFRPQSDRDRKVRELILQRADDFARRKGMDRREFMASTMGMATTLSVLNFAAGCGGKDGMMKSSDVGAFMKDPDRRHTTADCRAEAAAAELRAAPQAQARRACAHPVAAAAARAWTQACACLRRVQAAAAAAPTAAS